jgi:hypothetical protein
MEFAVSLPLIHGGQLVLPFVYQEGTSWQHQVPAAQSLWLKLNHPQCSLSLRPACQTDSWKF